MRRFWWKNTLGKFRMEGESDNQDCVEDVVLRICGIRET